MTNAERYPTTWKQQACACKARANWQCQECLAVHGTIVRSPRTRNLYVIYLQAAHLHHDHDNPNPELIAVCPTCHGRYYRRRPRPGVVSMQCKRLRRLVQQRGAHHAG